jgi:phosphoesterase RecJ-like protein
MIATATVEQIAAALGSGGRCLVTSHPSPDGDAVGCTVASILALRGQGREVIGYNADPVPRRFRFLRGSELITCDPPEGRFDLTLIVDCSDARMLQGSLPPPPARGNVVVVDHHLTAGSLEGTVLCDPNAASVGILLYKIFRAMATPLDLPIAEALFCSIMSDTGSFRYQNTDPEAMRISAALLELGVDPWRVASHLYEDRPRRELDLLARVLGTLWLSPDGRAATLEVTEEMLAATGCAAEVIDGLINYARGVEGVEVAVLFRPGEGCTRASLRSRGNVDVSRIAEQFGGGGHRNAAGFVVAGNDVAALRARIVTTVSEVLDAADGAPR